MITPPTDFYWVVRVEGDAAEVVAMTLSASTMADIHEAVLISDDFANDIEATISLDDTVEYLKSLMPTDDLIEMSDVNPLYVPSTPEQLDSVLEGDSRSENLAFTGMDGSPFTLKMVEVSDTADNHIIQGKLSCRPFDLPTYSEIVKSQASLRLN